MLSKVLFFVPLLALAPAALAQNGGDGHMNQAGLTLLEGYESFKPNFYNDGTGTITIGYGHACGSSATSSRCNYIHAPITEAQGQQLLQTDIGQYETCVCNTAGAGSLNTNQFSAMVDFAYNAGCGSLATAFASDIGSGNYADIVSKLPNTNTRPGSKVHNGLVKRRQAEVGLFQTSTSVMSGCGSPSTKPPYGSGKTTKRSAGRYEFECPEGSTRTEVFGQFVCM